MQEQETPEEIEEVAEEALEETPVPNPPKPTDEMKIVIILKADRVMLGVQSPDCDPVYTTMDGSLDMALERIPALVAEAKQKWEAAPRYPKADLPEPPPSATPARRTAATQPAKEKAQPSFF